MYSHIFGIDIIFIQLQFTALKPFYISNLFAFKVRQSFIYEMYNLFFDQYYYITLASSVTN